MRKLCLILLCICATYVTAHAEKISGKVLFSINGKQEAGAFATVACIEQSKVVEANEEGEFSISLKKADKITLIASFIGYTRDTILVVNNGANLYENRELLFTIKEENELNSVVVTGKQEANYLSKMTPIRTEVISAAGLCKMACCNLAESFENSASVSVGFSDAVTGARQIKLLGLSGSYTQMLDENRPIMRGMASPFGLGYIPGQWLESIQIAKGPSSVINGTEAITGQINMEHRKPTAENPLFVNLFTNSNLKAEGNIASSLALNDKWSTVIMAHASKDNMAHDGNGDGFRDDPLTTQFNLDNRWLYFAQSGMQLRFGVKAFSDERIGGMMDFEEGMNGVSESTGYSSAFSKGIWGSEIKNKGIDGFVKLGIPLGVDQSKNIAFVVDHSFYNTNSSFGLKGYEGTQQMTFVNAMFQNEVNENNRYTLGVSFHNDYIIEGVADYITTSSLAEGSAALSYNYLDLDRQESAIGAYGEYTYTGGDKITAVIGARADYNSRYGLLFVPRANVKYSITPNSVLRLSGGRGYRTPNIIADNLGVLSTGRAIVVEEEIEMEDAWTFGGNFTQYFKLGESENSYISFDYFRSSFNNQLIVDWDKNYSDSQDLLTNSVTLYNLDGRSFTDTYQMDLSVEPVERLTAIVTFRYTNAKVTMDGQGLVDRPLTSKYKGVFNVQYATTLNKWVFDATAQLNGPSILPQFMGGGTTDSYPMFYAQVTRKIKKVEVYVGAENIANYKQENPILNSEDPFSTNFNASMIWGPLMGRMFYIGMRLTLWK